MLADTLPEVKRLSKAEKLLLANELWDEIAEDGGELTLTRDQIAELDRRMEHHRVHPNEVTTWPEIKARLQSLKRRGA
jgi:putative addiction module component (TIGR02574 family)